MAWFRKSTYTTLQKPERSRIPQGLWTKCPSCMEPIISKDWEEAHGVCPRCGFHNRLGASKRLAQLLDENSFVEHDAGLTTIDALEFVDTKPYAQRLKDAKKKTGMSEAVVCGIGKIHGQSVSIAVMDINFIGGSMGVVVGEKIARTLERGIEEELPVILITASGGARMQEGALSLMQMAKTCAVAARLAKAGLPLFAILTDPTTGGVTASFAMIGDVTIAEKKALVGFAGPRVIEQTIKQILPPGFQRSEFVAKHGFIDIVCDRSELRITVGNLLSFCMHSRNKKKNAKRSAQASTVEQASSALAH